MSSIKFLVVGEWWLSQT